MLARHLRAPASEQHGSVPPIKNPKNIPPPPLPRKTHRFRNFSIFVTLATAAVYGGGAYLAQTNDYVYDYYTKYLPGANEAFDFVEKYTKKELPYSAERVHQISERAVARARVETAKAVEAAKAKVDSVVGHQEHKKDTPAPAAPATTASSAAPAAPQRPSSALSNITGRNFDSNLSALVRTLNEYTQNVNSGRATDSDISKLETALQDVNAALDNKYQAAQKEFSKKLEIQGQELHKELEETKQRLVDVYNQRLEAEIQAARSTVLAEANNRIHSQYVEMHEVAAKRAKKFVDDERNGRLSGLKQLEGRVNQLQNVLIDTGSAIGDNDSVVNYVTQVARLRTALGGEAVPLAPQLSAIRRALPKDPLVVAAVEAVPREVQEHGVLSVSQLAARFSLIAPEIRRVSLVPPNAGLGGHFASSVLSGLMFRKHGLPEGNDVESVLARTETYLSQGKVIDAVAEVNSLKGWPKEIAKDWLYEGRKRSEVEFLVKVLAEEGHLHTVSRG